MKVMKKFLILMLGLLLFSGELLVFAQDGYQQPIVPDSQQEQTNTGGLYDQVLQQQKRPIVEQQLPTQGFEQQAPPRRVEQRFQDPAAGRDYDEAIRRPLKGRVVVVPAGFSFETTLVTTLSSGINRVGDKVIATIASPVYLGRDEVIPAGSQIIGQIVNAVPAKRFRAGAGGLLELRFTSINTPQGQYPISGSIDQTQFKLQADAGHSRLAMGAAKTALGAGLGAALGTAIGAIAGGKEAVGRGAWSGAAIGGGAGLLGSVASKGEELILSSGVKIPIKLEQSYHALVPQRN